MQFKQHNTSGSSGTPGVVGSHTVSHQRGSAGDRTTESYRWSSLHSLQVATAESLTPRGVYDGLTWVLSGALAISLGQPLVSAVIAVVGTAHLLVYLGFTALVASLLMVACLGKTPPAVVGYRLTLVVFGVLLSLL